MSEPVRGRGRGGVGRGRGQGQGQGRGRGRGGDGEEREKWTDREKDIIRKMLAPGTVFYNIIKGDGTSYAKHKAWQDICDEFCYQSGRPTVKLQKLREMYKKDCIKLSKEKRVEYDQFMARERDFQSYSKGTGGGRAAPQPFHDPDIHGENPSLHLPRIPRDFDALTDAPRNVLPPTMTSAGVEQSEYIFPPNTTLHYNHPHTIVTTTTATNSSSLSAPVVGFSTGVSPTNAGVPVVDNTETESADAGGTTENVEDYQTTMRQFDAICSSAHDHVYGQTHHPDDFGVSVANAMMLNRTETANRLPLSTLGEDEHMEEVIDTQEIENANDGIPAAPATTPTNTAISRDALSQALDVTARFLDPANRATATPVPTTVIQQLPVVRQEGRGRQDNTGENADRGQRQRIKAARGDVALAAEKYYNDMLEIQRKCGEKYVEYLSAKMANEKAMHDKDIELKNKDLELKEAELQQMRQ